MSKRALQRLNDSLTYIALLPTIIAGSIIVLAFWAMVASNTSLETARDQNVEKLLRENRIKVNARLDAYAQFVVGGVGRINSGGVDRQTWSQFINTFDLDNDYPELYTTGVNEIVRTGERNSFELQKSDEFDREITIFPSTEQRLSAPVSVVQPENSLSLQSIGLDSYNEELRKTAMQKAASEDTVVVSEPLQLFNDPSQLEKGPEVAFFMFAPYYDRSLPLETTEQRTSAVDGYVFAAFLADDVFRSIFSEVDLSRTGVEVYMQAEQDSSLLYAANAQNPRGPTETVRQEINAYGQKFLVVYTFDRNGLVSRAQASTPLVILLLGIILSLLLGAISYYSLLSRQHKLSFEKERDIQAAKDELLSLASHQLRTPATGVKQYMGMVLQGFAGGITATQKEYLERAYESNERQLRIINDILHLAKIDAGRIVLSKRDFDLARAVRDAADDQQDAAKKASIKLEVSAPKRSKYHGDEHMLRMVLENLITNSLKYSKAHTTVTIKLRKKTGVYQVSVHDQGVGISKQDIPKLFRQFSRIPNERSHEVSGTGVGLYLSQHLARLHDGEIIVESDVGKGSTFTVVLPINV